MPFCIWDLGITSSPVTSASSTKLPQRATDLASGSTSARLARELPRSGWPMPKAASCTVVWAVSNGPRICGLTGGCPSSQSPQYSKEIPSQSMWYDRQMSCAKWRKDRKSRMRFSLLRMSRRQKVLTVGDVSGDNPNDTCLRRPFWRVWMSDGQCSRQSRQCSTSTFTFFHLFFHIVLST